MPTVIMRVMERFTAMGVSHADRRRIMAENFLLGHLSAAELDKLVTYTRIERFRAGRPIFAKGDPGDSMMAVLEGRVKISSPSDEGKEIVLNIIGPGEVFGEIALLDGKERTADAAAMTDCELLVLSRRDFLPFLQRNNDVCLLLLGVLCERLRRTSEQVEDVLFRHLESRLAKALLRLAHGAEGNGEGTRLRIDVKLSQRELGNLVGATRESVNKHLHVWQRQGIISLDKGTIVIEDVDALTRYA
jgi:CRP/FNR family cyclic AMP-dependent transcriptional regulator